MTIVSELSRLIGLYQLFEVSETEQNLVCQNNHQEIVEVRSPKNSTETIFDYFRKSNL